MNPKRILALWRERWGKAGSASFQIPYVHGKVTQWSQRLVSASIWSVPGATGAAIVFSILYFSLTLTLKLSLNQQIVFSLFLAAAALFVRRHASTVITLLLMGMSLIASTRYLFWRVEATLGPDFNLEFLMGFGLWTAELYFWVFSSTRLVQALWPLTQEAAPIEENSEPWPTLDVFVQCNDKHSSAIEATLSAARAFDWPRTKIKLYAIATQHDEAVEAMVTALGATYVTADDPASSIHHGINLALLASKGELIALMDGDKVLDPNFLKTPCSWFLQDDKLGMLATPHHDLLPPPCDDLLHLFESAHLMAPCVLWRRSALLAIDGVSEAPVTQEAHTGLQLQAAGYSCAGFGIRKQTELERTADVEAPNPTHANLIRVDSPFSQTHLRWKLKLSSFSEFLQFYDAVPRLVFFTAPVVFLLLGISLIQTSGSLLAAYALPHVFHMHTVQARIQGKRRYSWFADLRELTLAGFILLRTFLSLTRTELGLLKKGWAHWTTWKPSTREWCHFLPYLALFLMNLTAVAHGALGLLLNSKAPYGMALIYLCWSAYNVMVIAAMLAVTEEAHHIRKQQHLYAQMPAMIKLSSGRTMSCTTENFPASILALQLPATLGVEIGQPLQLSIFRNTREFVFPANVISQQGQVLRLTIDDTFHHEYLALGSAAFSRGDDWPKWLPGRDADQPFPAWTKRWIPKFNGVIRSLMAKLPSLSSLVNWGSWIKIWKKK
jgi:cellulose synthase (UDP-forming)